MKEAAESSMTRRTIRTDRLIAALGVAILALGAVILWGVFQGQGVGFTQEPVDKRVLRQAREQLGRDAEVRLIDPGRGRVVCGYVGHRGRGDAWSYISRPNRMMLSNDPLANEFKTMLARDCPTFPQPPRNLAIP